VGTFTGVSPSVGRRSKKETQNQEEQKGEKVMARKGTITGTTKGNAREQKGKNLKAKGPKDFAGSTKGTQPFPDITASTLSQRKGFPAYGKKGRKG